ncbi:Snf1p protein-interacting protein [Scheffersomyces amazonensis]|uniref:Snf1p protein-interacting protein n=1 Tax=Scheffersomyces amazonensis TaxID=1078765 RepID=UPI00315DB53C
MSSTNIPGNTPIGKTSESIPSSTPISTPTPTPVSSTPLNSNGNDSTSTSTPTPTRQKSKTGRSSRSSTLSQSTRQFKLISVNFKEAALDSPSFRASVNHLDIQIANIEKWLVALTSSVKKFPSYIKEVQSFCNSFLEHLVPTFLQDGLIDQEYTVQSLHTTLGGLKKLWGLSLNALNVNYFNLEKTSGIITKNIIRYKELRKKYEITQEKYDTYLDIYLSTSKSKDPIMVMEDAKQLYQVRKEYIHASLDLIIELCALGNLIDKSLVGLSTYIWKSKFSQFVNDSIDPYFKEQAHKIMKIQSWCDSYSEATDKLYSDMILARGQVEESSSLQFVPSTDISDYKTALINNKTLNEIDEKGLEKHGYLFMKTWTEKSSKPIWVKRWAFIKGGVFGLLVLSSSQTFVQETDKIGILLCNVKYTPNEDRRFCFELKTSDMTIVFQTETFIELKSWLKVFENERNRILHSEDNDDIFNIASGRYPPIVAEFASTANTTVDRDLTNTRIMNSMGQIVTSSNLSNHIRKDEKYFQKHLYYQIPQIRPPFMTDTTKSSIISFGLTAATSLPTALTANLWGSVNWGIYYLHDAIQDHEHNDATNARPEQELIDKQCSPQGDSGLYYPDYYPPSLVPLDIQMRALFETAVEQGEYCIVSFRCIWSPNSRQELSGRCFITSHHIYFYMQALGFVALFKAFVGHLVAVDYSAQKHFDLLKLYTVNGVIKTKLFLDDGKLIKQKLVYLINNLASETPKKFKELLHDLALIEQKVHTENKDQQKLKLINQISRSLSEEGKAKLNFQNLDSRGDKVPSFVSTDSTKLEVFKYDFSRDYNYVFERTYDLPPKAIFHALLGDDSIIFKDHTTFARLECFIKKPWSTSPNGNLYRTIIAPANYEQRRLDLRIDQEIDNMVDNQYYTFTHTKSKMKLFLGSKFSETFKFAIIGIAGKQCKVYFYTKTQFEGYQVMNPFIHEFSKQLASNQIKHLDKRLQLVVKEVGNHGMIVKSIYLYGKLSHTSISEKEERYPVISISLISVMKMIFFKLMVTTTKGLFQVYDIAYNTVLIFIKGIRMNQVLLIIIGFLCLTNLFFAGKTSATYWTVRRANQIAHEYIFSEPMMLKRAVYLQDIHDLIENNYSIISINEDKDKEKDENENEEIKRNSTSNNKSLCYKNFKEKSFMLNYDQPNFWDLETINEPGEALKKQFIDIGVKRHELIVQLKILNDMEREIAQAEWQNFLLSELERCEYVSSNILKNIGIDGIEQGIESVVDYCRDCSNQLSKLNLL